MEKPINAEQRDHDRKERTKFPKKSIPIAKRAATQCLHARTRAVATNAMTAGRCRRVEIKARDRSRRAARPESLVFRRKAGKEVRLRL